MCVCVCVCVYVCVCVSVYTLNWEIFTTNNIHDFRELTSLANLLSRIFLHPFQSIGIDNVW